LQYSHRCRTDGEKRNSINSPAIIALRGGIDKDGAGNPKIREATRDIIVIEDMPIGSAGQNGLYLVETIREHEGELRSLKRREEEIRRRRTALERAVQKEAESRSAKYPAEVSGPQEQLTDDWWVEGGEGSFSGYSRITE